MYFGELWRFTSTLKGISSETNRFTELEHWKRCRELRKYKPNISRRCPHVRRLSRLLTPNIIKRSAFISERRGEW